MQPLHLGFWWNPFSLFTWCDLFWQMGLLTPAGSFSKIQGNCRKKASSRWDRVQTVPHNSTHQFFKPRCTNSPKTNHQVNAWLCRPPLTIWPVPMELPGSVKILKILFFLWWKHIPGKKDHRTLQNIKSHRINSHQKPC